MTELKEILSASVVAQTINSEMFATVVERMHHTERDCPPARETCDIVPLKPAIIEPALPISGSGLPLSPNYTSTSASLYTLSSPMTSTGLTQITGRSWQVSMPIRFTCMEWCSCICHQRHSLKSPWLLRSILGYIYIEYGIPDLACNEQSCRRHDASSIKIAYRLPSYLINRHITMAWMRTPLEGSAFSLRMPRVMPWTHPLWKFANCGDIIAIQRMFSEGKASPYDATPLGGNALTYASSQGYTKLGQFLIQQGADADIADCFGSKPIERFWDMYLSGQIETEESQIVENMLEGFDYAETRCFTLMHKIVLGILSRDLESELRSSTASINATDALGRTSICWAVLRDDIKAVRTLLTFNANPNLADYRGNNCLFYVRSTEVCKLLLHANTDLHLRNQKMARVPLHHLCNNAETAETPDMIELFVNAGADVNVRNYDGETPLLNAVFNGYTSIACKLIELGADVNISNHSSNDATIHLAVSFDHPEILPLLIDKGADYKARNINGRNILHMAARTGSARIAAALSTIKLAGLDTSLKDVEGKTAHDYLAEREILSDSEVGLYENFEKLLASITPTAPPNTAPMSSTSPASGTRDLASQHDPGFSYYIPGAYPSIDGEL